MSRALQLQLTTVDYNLRNHFQRNESDLLEAKNACKLMNFKTQRNCLGNKGFFIV